MRGRAFLNVSRDAVLEASEEYWRMAATSAYYGAMLECRDALARWRFSVPPRQNVHAYVRLRMTYAADPQLKQIGDALDWLVKLRNQACYFLHSARFASSADTLRSIQKSSDAIALLDQIEADPALRAAAIASIQP